MATRRRQYRLPLRDQDMLSASVCAPKKSPIQGTIEDISACGLRVFFKAAVDPRYSPREIIPLRLASRYLKEPVTVRSLVASRSNFRGGTLYGFEIIDWLGLLSGLPEELKALFNQRRDYRVRPHAEQPVVITVLGGDKGFRAKIPAEDVSASGLSFVTGRALDRVLGDLETVDLSLRLPTTPERLHFRVKILHREVVHDGTRYGVFLVEEPTQDFERQAQILAAYVNRRHREILGMAPEKLGSSQKRVCVRPGH